LKILLVAKLTAALKEKGELAAPSNCKLPKYILGLVIGFNITSSTQCFCYDRLRLRDVN